jgi:Low-density lipoprotein receptor domain class A
MHRVALVISVVFLVHCSLARIVVTPVPVIFPQEELLGNMFRCDINKYIPKDWICDGVSNCIDRTDEAMCSRVYSVEPSPAT